MEVKRILFHGRPGDKVVIHATKEGLVSVETRFSNTGLQALLTHEEANSLVELLWRATLAAKEACEEASSA